LKAYYGSLFTINDRLVCGFWNSFRIVILSLQAANYRFQQAISFSELNGLTNSLKLYRK